MAVLGVGREPPLAPPESKKNKPERADALRELVRGRMEVIGPITASALANFYQLPDSEINGALPANTYHLNEQTTWAVGYYTAYGIYTSINGAIATWGIIAGLT